jgi:hypothetical protein
MNLDVIFWLNSAVRRDGAFQRSLCHLGRVHGQAIARDRTNDDVNRDQNDGQP